MCPQRSFRGSRQPGGSMMPASSIAHNVFSAASSGERHCPHARSKCVILCDLMSPLTYCASFSTLLRTSSAPCRRGPKQS
eukprot:4888505-Pyramimonas_sp.AAC.1